MDARDVFNMSGKVVAVTGGSRGMGEQMVRAFAANGADVVVASRKFDNCVAVARDIEATTGRRAMPYQLHAAHWDEAEPFVDAVYAEFGKCDVFVNNAGMSILYDKLTDVTEEMFDKVIGLNFKGPFRLASLFGERMKAAGSGAIINVSSTGSLRAALNAIPYSGAKAALNMMTEGMAQVLGPEVRVNTLMPGMTNTDIAKAWDPVDSEALAKNYALRRIGEPREIVGAALLLASDAGSYISSSYVRVDGGIP
jgi:NAD(P)-dependent dehydrogenase (short-subunit alcohol dehydrogenase family)